MVFGLSCLRPRLRPVLGWWHPMFWSSKQTGGMVGNPPLTPPMSVFVVAEAMDQSHLAASAYYSLPHLPRALH
jgi:hypothetical protein